MHVLNSGMKRKVYGIISLGDIVCSISGTEKKKKQNKTKTKNKKTKQTDIDATLSWKTYFMTTFC